MRAFDLPSFRYRGPRAAQRLPRSLEVRASAKGFEGVRRAVARRVCDSTNRWSRTNRLAEMTRKQGSQRVRVPDLFSPDPAPERRGGAPSSIVIPSGEPREPARANGENEALSGSCGARGLMKALER